MESSTLSYPPTRSDPSTNNVPVREGGKPRHWAAMAWWLTQTHPSRQRVASGSGAVDGRPPLSVSGLAPGLAPERVTCRKLGCECNKPTEKVKLGRALSRQDVLRSANNTSVAVAFLAHLSAVDTRLVSSSAAVRATLVRHCRSLSFVSPIAPSHNGRLHPDARRRLAAAAACRRRRRSCA
jgi:hypothetical protein